MTTEELKRVYDTRFGSLNDRDQFDELVQELGHRVLVEQGVLREA